MQWYFLVASLGELRQKKVYTKGALTGKKRLWWDDSLWQIVCLPTLESLMVPTTLKSFHSSAVNKHLWNEGWFKYKITAAVGVCLSIICSATQVCKRFAYDGLCDCPFSDGICSLQKQMKGFQMSHKVVDSHTKFRGMNMYIQCKNPLIFLFRIQFSMLDVFAWWMKQNSVTETAELPEFEGMVSSRHGAMWDHIGLLNKEIKCWLVGLVLPLQCPKCLLN